MYCIQMWLTNNWYYDVCVRHYTVITCGCFKTIKDPVCHMSCTAEEIVDFKTSTLLDWWQLWCGLATRTLPDRYIQIFGASNRSRRKY